MTGWAVEALIASALLMLVVLGIRGPVRRLFGARIAYMLWALPALRLVLPPLPGAWRTAAATPIGRAGETIVVFVAAPAAVPVASISPLTVVGIVWAAGVVTLLAWHLIGHARFRARLLADAKPLNVVDGIQVIASAAAPGPLACGICRRFVAFPMSDINRYDAEERALALAHELTHHSRRDLHANWAALVVLALHWCNPVAWVAYRAFRADQELACDADVLAVHGPRRRHAYARAILKAAHGAAFSPACHLHTVTDIKRRLKMLALSPTSGRRLRAGRVTTSMLMLAGLGLTASGSTAAVVVTRVVDALPQAVPLPPAPPAPPAPPMPPVSAKHMTGNDAHRQVRTIVVRSDGRGMSTLLVKGNSITPGSPLPGGATLPNDFELPKDCEGGTPAAPLSYVIKGENGNRTYTVLCTRAGEPGASASGATAEHKAYQQALVGLRDLRSKVKAQVRPSFPEQERRRALAAIDSSIAEIEGDLAKLQ